MIEQNYFPPTKVHDMWPYVPSDFGDADDDDDDDDDDDNDDDDDHNDGDDDG